VAREAASDPGAAAQASARRLQPHAPAMRRSGHRDHMRHRRPAPPVAERTNGAIS